MSWQGGGRKQAYLLTLLAVISLIGPLSWMEHVQRICCGLCTMYRPTVILLLQLVMTLEGKRLRMQLWSRTHGHRWSEFQG